MMVLVEVMFPGLGAGGGGGWAGNGVENSRRFSANRKGWAGGLRDKWIGLEKEEGREGRWTGRAENEGKDKVGVGVGVVLERWCVVAGRDGECVSFWRGEDGGGSVMLG